MNIEVLNSWPLALVPLPREKALQNEYTAQISFQAHTNPIILNNVKEIESNESWAKGSFIDVYI